MQQTTRERILQVGAEMIHRKGFNNTGIQEILNAVQVPKGSFYNYFKSKEDFGLQVIDHFDAHFSRLVNDILEDGSLSPLERIRKFLNWFTDFFRSKDYACGCPFGNLSQEMGDLSPAFRDRLKVAIDSMAQNFTKVLREAQIAGEISETLDPGETAYFIIASWQGALMRMKIVKGPAPLENHRRFIFDYILKP